MAIKDELTPAVAEINKLTNLARSLSGELKSMRFHTNILEHQDSDNSEFSMLIDRWTRSLDEQKSSIKELIVVLEELVDDWYLTYGREKAIE